MPPVTGAPYGAAFQFTLMTADRDVAAAADAAGVDRIGLDIERIGKAARQGHLPHLRISSHQIPQLAAIRARLTRARAFLRCNPLHTGSRDEIVSALDAGAQVVMLPYFHTASEVEQFVALVDGRAEVSLLVETRSAAQSLDAILRVPGITEIMVGLNDLQHDIGLPNPFAVVTSAVMESVARRVCAAGVRFGFGGLADPAYQDLPISPGLVAAQYPRLGATAAFVARRFTAGGLPPDALAAGLARCRATLQVWSERSEDALADAREDLARAARAWATSPPEGQRTFDESAEDGWQRMLLEDLRPHRG